MSKSITRAMFVFAIVGTTACASAQAATIPSYTAKGVENATTYTFVAKGGDIKASYLGTSALYDETLGLLANGKPVASGVFENHATDVGSSYDFGSFAKGTVLTFSINVEQTGETFYSNAGMNGDGANHIYSADYQGGDGVPAGTYVGFEDLSANRKIATRQALDVDYNYADEQFSFTNLAMIPSTVPLPATAPMFGAALVALGAVSYGLKRKGKAAAAA